MKGERETKQTRVRRCRDRQMSQIFLTCHLCGGEIYVGQTYYDRDGMPICEDCLPEYARTYFLSSLRTAFPERIGLP